MASNSVSIERIRRTLYLSIERTLCASWTSSWKSFMTKSNKHSWLFPNAVDKCHNGELSLLTTTLCEGNQRFFKFLTRISSLSFLSLEIFKFSSTSKLVWTIEGPKLRRLARLRRLPSARSVQPYGNLFGTRTDRLNTNKPKKPASMVLEKFSGFLIKSDQLDG